MDRRFMADLAGGFTPTAIFSIPVTGGSPRPASFNGRTAMRPWQFDAHANEPRFMEYTQADSRPATFQHSSDRGIPSTSIRSLGSDGAFPEGDLTSAVQPLWDDLGWDRLRGQRFSISVFAALHEPGLVQRTNGAFLKAVDAQWRSLYG